MTARPSASERGYGSKWRKESAEFLARPENRLCARGCGCLATRVDHIEPHRGDKRLFWSRRNWQPICQPCHDGPKQREERQGYSERLGLDGLPSDPRHPFNRETGGVAERAARTPGGSKVGGSRGGDRSGESTAQLVSRRDGFRGAI